MPTTIPKRQFLRYIALGVACLSHTTFAEPTVSVAAQIHAQPQTPEDLRKAAMEAGKVKNWPQSLEIFGRYLQMQPEDEEAWLDQGYVLHKLERYEEAIASYRRATEIKPGSLEAWNGLCWHQILAGQFSAARFSCERHVAISADSMAATVNLGHTYLLQGDRAGAWHWYEKTIQLIDNESDLKEGPLGDFEIFLKRGWQPQLTEEGRRWFEEHGTAWLQSKAPADQLFKEAQAAADAKDFDRAIALREQRIPLLEALYREDDQRVINAIEALGDLNTQAGRFAEALPLYQRVLAYREKQPESEERRLAFTLDDVARTLKSLARYAEAEPLYVRALAISEKANGPEHPSTGTYLNNLALLYDTMGQYARAEPLYVRALAISEKANGPEHPWTDTILNNLVTTLTALKRHEEALTYKQRALAMAERAWGAEDSKTVNLTDQLANQYRATGRAAEALPLYQRVYRRATEIKPGSLEAWNGLCWTQILLNRPLDARPSCEKAVSLNKTSFASLVNLGHTFLLAGDTKTADYWYHETLRNIESKKDLKEGPLADFDIFIAKGWQVEASHKAKAWLEQEATSWIALRTQATEIIAKAKVAGKQENLVAIIASLKEITPLLEGLYGAESQFVGSLLTALADCMDQNGQYAEAMQQRLRVLHIVEANFGIAHENVRQSEEDITSLNRERFGLDAETDFRTSRLALVEGALGEQHKRTSDLRSKLITILMEQERYAETLPLIEKSIRIAERNPSTNKNEETYLPYLLNKLADIYHGLGRSEDAISIYLNLGSPYCSSTGLVDIYTDLLRYKEAISNYEICPPSQFFSEKLGLFYRVEGNFDKAIQIYSTLLAQIEKSEIRGYDFDRLFYLSTLADLYRAKGAHTEALAAEKKAIQFLPEYARSAINKNPEESDHDVDVKPWELNKPRLVANTGHSNGVVGMALSLDRRQLITAGARDKVKIWDIATGREIYSFDNVTKDRVEAFAMSKDGRWMALGSSTGFLEIWDMRSRVRTRAFKAHLDGIEAMVFAPDGLTLASTSDQSIRLWSVTSGLELQNFPAERSVNRKLIFSPDGKELLTTGRGKVYIWNCATGALIGTLRKKNWLLADNAESLAFDRGGEILAVGGDGGIQLWDYRKRTVVRTMYLFSNRLNTAKSVIFSPDGKFLISGHSWGVVRVWDVSTGKEIRQFDDAVHAGEVGNLLVLENGTLLTSGDHGNEIRFWDTLYGVRQREFGGTAETISSIAYSESRKLLATGRWRINLWDLRTGQEKSAEAHNIKIRGLIFSPDGDKLASAGGRQIKLLDVRTQKELWSATTSANEEVKWTNLDLSPDSKTLVSNDYESVKRWEFDTGRMLDNWDAPSNIALQNAFFSSSGEYWVRDQKDIVRNLETWLPAEAQERKAHVININGLDATIDGNVVVLREKGASVWKARLISFNDGHWAVTDPEGRFDASNGGDIPHLHWVFDNTPIDLAQLKDRYYDPGLLQKIMGFSKEPLRTVPKFEDALLHKWPEVAVSADDRNPLRLNIRLTNRGDGYGRVRVRLNDKEITADATAGKKLSGKIVSLNLDLDPTRLLPGDNRIDVVAWPGVGHIPSPAAQLVVSGAAARGAVRTGDGKVQAANKPLFAEPVTLHAIVMGVSQYAGPHLRLAFPGKDAADIAQAIELGGTRLFGADRVRLHLLSDYAAAPGTNVTAEHLPTRDNLRHAFETIAKEAKAGDILLVYLAGHGVMTPGAAGEAEYYYLSREAQSSDLSDPAVRKLWGVSSRELTEWIKRIKAAKQVMVLDTCSAGGAIEKLVAKRQIPGAQVIAMEQLKDRTGVHILAGAAADKVSYEASQFGQGLLTYALLTGMKGAALKDEIIDVQKLFQYTRDEVPKLARQIGGIQEPRLSSPQGESFAIGRMAEDDRKKVPLAQIKPMIQRTSFQDEAKMKDVIKLGQRFDDRLKLETYAAARGSMIYVDADDFPEAWQVSGRYRKEADGVRVMARLFRGEEEKGAFEVLLPLDEAGQTEALLAATLKAMGRGL